jgi:hypothetical protein
MRNRSTAISITNNSKIKMSQDLMAFESFKDNEKKQKITDYIEEKLKIKKRSANTRIDNSILFPPPQYLDIKKDYANSTEKVLNFY